MSLVRKEILKCPKCGAENQFRFYDSVNVSLDPELKEKVLNTSLFKMKCSKCGSETVVRYDLLYHDMSDARPLLIQCCQKKEGWEKINEQNENVRKMMADMNLSNEFPHRVVIGYTALLEALRIFDAGYDDRVMFVLKMVFAAMLKRDHQECKGLLFCGKDDKGQPLFSVLDDEFKPKLYNLTEDIYNNISEKLLPLLPPESEQHILIDHDYMLPYINRIQV